MTKERLHRAASIPARLASDDEPDWIEAIHYYAFGLRQQGRGWRPPTDVYETDEAIVVLIEVAGMRRQELAVTLDEQVLRVRGRRQHRAGLAAYHQMEINDGEFTVEVRVSVPVDRDGIDASYSNGFLRVRLPKTGPRQIPIGS